MPTRPTPATSPSAASNPLELSQQVEDLRAALAAIRSGGVDAVVLGDASPDLVYTLSSADRPYRVILEEMGEGAASISERGVLLFANRTLQELTGRSSAELLGSQVTTLVPTDDQERLVELLTLRAGETRRAELRLLRGGGDLVPVLASVTGLDLEGVLVRCLIVANTTEAKRVQAELAASHARVVAHSQALVDVNDQLRRSNEELSQFAYVTSHDLSEPLRTITGFADLLRQRYGGRLDADADEFLGFIINGTARMQELIDGILQYSRVETRARPREPVDTDQIVADVLADLQLRVREVRAQIDVASLPRVEADPRQLHQVFTNLLGNSLKFVHPGVEPRIRVSAERTESAWAFTVADNGIGIEERFRDRVFRMFQRLHTADEYPGTGVGLSVAQKVVRQHRGAIWISDNPGGGTRVTFTIGDGHGAAPDESLLTPPPD